MSQVHDKIKYLQDLADDYQKYLKEAEHTVVAAEFRNWMADSKSTN